MKKTPGPNDFSDEFYHTFQEKIPIPHKYFQETEEDRILSTVFYEMRITPKPKPGQRNTIKKKILNIKSHQEHTRKNS